MSLSRLFACLVLLEIGAADFACGNPQIFVCGEPIALIAENVDMAVQKNQSAVSGAYTFRQVHDGYACPQFAGEPMVIRMPVIVSGQQSFGSLKSSTAISLTIGRRTFYPSSASSDSLYDLPPGWKLCSFKFEIPMEAIGDVFTFAVRYFQAHLPGNIAPYYPIHPPERWAPKSIVRYSVAEPASLTLVSRGETVFEKKRTRISVQPQHHKLILVRLNKS